MICNANYGLTLSYLLLVSQQRILFWLVWRYALSLNIMIVLHHHSVWSFTVECLDIWSSCDLLCLCACVCVCMYRQSLFMTQSSVRPGIWAPTSLSAKRMCWAREGGKMSHSLKYHTLTPAIHVHSRLFYSISVCLSLTHFYPPSFTVSHRVEAVCPRVAELNPYVHVDTSSFALDNNTDLSFLRKYQVRCCFSASGLWPTCGALEIFVGCHWIHHMFGCSIYWKWKAEYMVYTAEVKKKNWKVITAKTSPFHKTFQRRCI